jgi:putative aminopeptidase FrvX
MGYEYEQDAAGNLLVRLNGRNPHAPLTIYASHMDEIGFVVTRIEPDGRLRVDRSGGLHPWKLGESPVQILGDKETITGVLSMGSTHGTDQSDKAITWPDVHVLTGLSPDQLQAKGVRVGSPGVPVAESRGPYLFGDPDDPLVAAWTLDDRAGVMTLLRLLARLKGRKYGRMPPPSLPSSPAKNWAGTGPSIWPAANSRRFLSPWTVRPFRPAYPWKLTAVPPSGAKTGWPLMTNNCCSS